MRQALTSVAGVVDAEVSFDEKRAEVRYTSDLADPNLLVKAVEEIGFQARLIDPEASATEGQEGTPSG